MWNNIIGTHIQRTNRNLLFTSAVFLLAALAVALANARYMENFLTGPRPISAEQLAATHDPNTLRHYFVRVRGDKSLDTGMTEIEQERAKYSNEMKSEKVTAHFMLLRVGEKILLVKSDSGEETTEFTGALVPSRKKKMRRWQARFAAVLKKTPTPCCPLCWTRPSSARKAISDWRSEFQRSYCRSGGCYNTRAALRNRVCTLSFAV